MNKSFLIDPSENMQWYANKAWKPQHLKHCECIHATHVSIQKSYKFLARDEKMYQHVSPFSKNVTDLKTINTSVTTIQTRAYCSNCKMILMLESTPTDVTDLICCFSSTRGYTFVTILNISLCITLAQ